MRKCLALALVHPPCNHCCTLISPLPPTLLGGSGDWEVGTVCGSDASCTLAASASATTSESESESESESAIDKCDGWNGRLNVRRVSVLHGVKLLIDCITHITCTVINWYTITVTT